MNGVDITMQYNKSLGSIFLVIIVFLLTGCSASQVYNENADAVIDFIQVGKADAIAIFYKNKTILIDTGEDEDGAKVLSYLKKQKRNKIDEMIITHFDKDHVGGADVVLNGMEVKRVWQPNYKTNKEQFLEYKDVLVKRNIETQIVAKETTMKIDDLNLTIFPSGVKKTKEDNERSLVITMEHKGNTFFFAGDAQGKRLKELTKMKFGHFDVLKVPHHGRKDCNFENFCKLLKPKYAIITSSKEMMPDNNVIHVLEKENTKIYQTAYGLVHCVSTSEGINLIQK